MIFKDIMEFKKELFMDFIGTIALDIDGTITDDRRIVPEQVIAYLESLYEKRWQIVFITGREFVYTMQALAPVEFPYYLATQNGADIISMPERKLLKSYYFDKKVVLDLETLFNQIGQDFLLYSGFSEGDFCYYRNDKTPSHAKDLILWMQQRSALPWKNLKEFSECSQEKFPMIKAIGYEEDFLELEAKILKDHSLNFVTIQDPKTKVFHYLLITALMATKKGALEYLFTHHGLKRPLIVGGDDHNDKDSLLFADVSIAMENAPKTLKATSHIIAPLSSEFGIIKGIEKALKFLETKER